MEEKFRTCILCGKKEPMLGYICIGCQEKIQKEAMGRRKEMREAAETALRSCGVTPSGESK